MDTERFANKAKTAHGMSLFSPRGYIVNGLFFNERINKDILPEGWYSYDFKYSSKSDKPIAMKNNVFENYFGTFVSRIDLNLNPEGLLFNEYDNKGRCITRNEPRWDYSFDNSVLKILEI